MYESYFKLLNQYKSKLTKQQYKTFKGQIRSGDIKGFMKGFYKMIIGDDLKVEYYVERIDNIKGSDKNDDN